MKLSLPNKIFSNKSKKGFTLIELLIVIAVMGVLAAAVVAAINPLTKINSAKDADIKSDIGQIGSAMQAYYTIKGGATGTAYYPHRVVDLTPNGTPVEQELKTEPLTPAGASYTVTVTPSGCTTALKTCTNITVSALLNNPTSGLGTWCWRSATGIAAEIAASSCTP